MTDTEFLYDKTINEGDLVEVKLLDDCFYRVLTIKERLGHSPLVTVCKVTDSEGVKHSPRPPVSVDACHVKKMTVTTIIARFEEEAARVKLLHERLLVIAFRDQAAKNNLSSDLLSGR